MRKNVSLIAALLSLALCGGWIASAQNPEKDPSKTIQGNGTVVINTTTLCKDVDGFMGPTPIEIRIKKDTIINITPLANEETPGYFNDAVTILKKWIGLTPAKGLELEVDAVSGATFSSNSLIENVRAGLQRAMRE